MVIMAQAQPAPEHIREAAAYSREQRGMCLIVIHDGRPIWEEYAGGSTAAEANKIYSGTKIFWSIAALAAEEDGFLALKDAVADTIDEWRSERQKSRITIRQLLDFSGGVGPSFDLHGQGIRNRDAAAIARPLAASPGRRFIYGPASLQVFHAILKRKLAGRGETPTEYLERRVLAPMGLGPQRYLADGAGNPLLASGFMLTGRQWAEVGKLLLRGCEPVLRAAPLAERFGGSPANRAFGLGLWNNWGAGRFGGRGSDAIDIEEMLEKDWQRQRWQGICLCRSAPRDLFASIGSAGQRLYVVPSMNLVIVRMGKGAKFCDARFLGSLFPAAE